MEKPVTQKGILTREAVDRVTDQISGFLSEAGVEKKSALKMQLRLEDLILSACEHFDEKCEYTLETGHRFRKPFVRFSYEGESFNPLEDDGNDLLSGGWSNRFMADSGLSPSWNRRGNCNVLQLNLNRKKLGMLQGVLLGVVLSLIVGFAGKLLPEDVRKFCSEQILDNIQGMYFSALKTFAGLMIFLSVVCGIFEMGDASEFSRIGKRMIGRFLSNMLIITVICGIVAYAVFRPQFDNKAVGGSGLTKVVDMIRNIVPSNPVEPFGSGNTMQIVFLGVCFGVVLLVVGEDASKTVRNFSLEANNIVQKVIGWICRLIPMFIFVTFVSIIWKGTLESVGGIWKLIVFVFLFFIIYTIISVVRSAIRMKVKVGVLAKKLFPSFVVCLTTASSMAGLELSLENGEKKLGVDNRFLKVAMPIGSIVYKNSTTLECIAISIYLAKLYNIEVNVTWLIVAVILSIILAVAVPPVAGAGLTMFGALFSQLGLPMEGMVIAVTFDIVYDFLATGGNNTCLLSELIIQADKGNMIDRDVLRKPM